MQASGGICAIDRRALLRTACSHPLAALYLLRWVRWFHTQHATRPTALYHASSRHVLCALMDCILGLSVSSSAAYADACGAASEVEENPSDNCCPGSESTLPRSLLCGRRAYPALLAAFKVLLSIPYPTRHSTHLPTYPPTHLPTYPPTHLPTYPPTHLPTYPPTHLPTYPPTHLPTYPLTHLPTYPPTHLPTYPPTHLPTYPPTHLPTYPPTHLPTYPPTHLPTYPPTHLPIYPPTHLPIFLPILPIYLSTYLPIYPPNHLPTHLSIHIVDTYILFNFL